MAAFLILALTNCSLFSFSSDPKPTADGLSGSVLVRHGEYLYRIGGLDEEGNVSATTYFAKISTSGSPLQWKETTPLPEGRAFAAAVAAGNMIYVLGGSDGSGPTDTVYFIYANPMDGSLGIPTSTKVWQINPIPLHKKLSNMGHILHDGRIYLIGGIGADHVSENIIQARIHQNALVGQWYVSPQTLSTPRNGVAVSVQTIEAKASGATSKLVVAGGTGESGKVSARVTAYDLGPDGKLGLAQNLPDLPLRLTSPVLISEKHTLYVMGGLDEDLQRSTNMYRMGSSQTSWSLVDGQTFTAEGPSLGRVVGNFWYIAHNGGNENPSTVETFSMEGLSPDLPNIFPGSGYIYSNTTVMKREQPGSTTLYQDLNEGILTPFSSSLKIENPQNLTFGCTAGGITTTVYRSYLLRSFGLTDFYVSGYVALQGASNTALSTVHLRDAIANVNSTASSQVWVGLILDKAQSFTLRWKDRLSVVEPGGTAYSGKIGLGLYEDDLLTEAIDRDGNPVRNRGSSDGSIRLSLQAGTYYFLLQDLDGASGTTLGLALTLD